jgi:hypothetical protein
LLDIGAAWLSGQAYLCNASLREDYLNQVQRDFLSRGHVVKLGRNTPSDVSNDGRISYKNATK